MKGATMERRFEDIFRSNDPRRDNFLARLFALFGEEIVRHWCRCPGAAYEDLGRPTVRAADDPRGHTLDFTLRRKADGALFAAEMKCELAWEGYRYLRLTHPDQVVHHHGPAFQKLLALARDPAAFEVRTGGRPVTVSGAVLVWGALDDAGRSAAMDTFGFGDVLSVEAMLDDLRAWKPDHWIQRVGQLRAWSGELFDNLT